jgi:hypothetical protein
VAAAAVLGQIVLVWQVALVVEVATPTEDSELPDKAMTVETEMVEVQATTQVVVVVVRPFLEMQALQTKVVTVVTVRHQR